MAFANNATLSATDLNNLVDVTTSQTITGVKIYSAAGSPVVTTAQDFAEQSATPATPSAGIARIYVDNTNPPRLRIIQDDGDVANVGGWQYDETNRDWVLFDRDLTTLVQDRNQIVITDDFFKTNVDATAAQVQVHTVQGNWKYLATGAATFPATVGRGGVIRVQTAAAANNRVALLSGESITDCGVFRSPDLVQFMCILNLVETTAKVVQVGIAQDPTATLNPGTDGFYFQYDSSASANWRGIVRAGGANTDSDTTVAASTGTIHLLFVVSTSNCIFYTRTASTDAWTLRATNAGGQPGAIDLIPFMKVETLGAAAKNLDLYRVKIVGLLED